MEERPILECTVRVGREDGPLWRGTLLAAGRETPFHSEVELLREMDRLIAAGEKKEGQE